MSDDDDGGVYGEDQWERRQRKQAELDEHVDQWERRQHRIVKRDKVMFGSPGPWLVAFLAVLMWVVMTHWPQIRDAVHHKAGEIAARVNPPDLPLTVDARQVAAARKNLPNLTVHARTGRGYKRVKFGPAWTDDNTIPRYGHNGCDTRNDILRRDLTGETFRAGSRCVIVTGTLLDPYTGKTIRFVKARAAEVQIDHVVPLSYAWSEGAGAGPWTFALRKNFANDPLNLLAVDGDANQEKGDSGPAEWKPRDGARCLYAVRWTQITVRYRLPITPADKTALTTMLATCPTPNPIPARS
jgi:hypothetical protein